MPKLYTGRDGSMLLGNTTLAKVSNWNIQADLETLETTSLGDNLRSYTPGIQGFSGTATLMYYDVTNTQNDAGTLLRNLLKTGTTGVSAANTVSMKLRLVDGATTKQIVFNAYITSASIGASVGEIVSAQISFQITGALTEASL